jgi:HEAT repeat protein
LLACDDAAALAGALFSTIDASSATRAMRHRPEDLAAAWPEPQAGESALALALRAIDAAPPHAPPERVSPAITEALRAGLGSSSPLATERAIAAREGHLVLAAMPDALSLLDASRSELVVALPTLAGDVSARAAAARLLGAIAPADPRVPVLLADDHAAVVRATLEGIAADAELPAALCAPLARLASSASDWVVRLEAVHALARAPEAAEPALTAALTGDAFAFVREAAAQALDGRTAPAVTAALRAAAASDPEARVRAAAAAALR